MTSKQLTPEPNAFRDLDLITLVPKKESLVRGAVKPFESLITKLKRIQRENKRLLIMTRDIYQPLNACVVTIDNVGDRFATCHAYNRLSGESIPYTLNYASLYNIQAHISIQIES